MFLIRGEVPECYRKGTRIESFYNWRPARIMRSFIKIGKAISLSRGAT